MKLPKELPFRMMAFYRLANGGHMQTQRNEEYGITLHRIKDNRDSPWRSEFEIDCLPGKKFNSGKELAEALVNVDWAKDEGKIPEDSL